MSFRGKSFYIASFIICVVFAIIVKVTRTDVFGINNVLDTFLASSPSFFYLFGIMSIIPVVQPKINIKTFNKSVLILTAGALTYEMEQYWTSMHFDLGDITATLLAAILMLSLHQNTREAI
ncbi:hypothetical protein [Colwellia piezophila]|uniref:hypothetical protein n=1 Tax=Colwellia piezophila TaxID=211668 RepID=UPI0003736631|nr:hypothetical protein [Colwellia piezophila]